MQQSRGRKGIKVCTSAGGTRARRWSPGGCWGRQAAAACPIMVADLSLGWPTWGGKGQVGTASACTVIGLPDWGRQGAGRSCLCLHCHGRVCATACIGIGGVKLLCYSLARRRDLTELRSQLRRMTASREEKEKQ
ncbi:hypothetical protein CRG98_044356 [Punica granatum]|uniref:Uncharacterized protein n=1 Tax=Punica granatum TaxID=22663 RepID=A0A2I0HU71_PUNGR|nr:hypothetical protein CRG98_044356 [Punica granatum]